MFKVLWGTTDRPELPPADFIFSSEKLIVLKWAASVTFDLINQANRGEKIQQTTIHHFLVSSNHYAGPSEECKEVLAMIPAFKELT